MNSFREITLNAGSVLTAVAASAACGWAEGRFAFCEQIPQSGTVVQVTNGHFRWHTAEELEELALQREIAKHRLPIAEMRKLARKYPPPQSWYDEEELPF